MRATTLLERLTETSPKGKEYGVLFSHAQGEEVQGGFARLTDALTWMNLVLEAQPGIEAEAMRRWPGSEWLTMARPSGRRETPSQVVRRRWSA